MKNLPITHLYIITNLNGFISSIAQKKYILRNACVFVHKIKVCLITNILYNLLLSSTEERKSSVVA